MPMQAEESFKYLQTLSGERDLVKMSSPKFSMEEIACTESRGKRDGNVCHSQRLLCFIYKEHFVIDKKRANYLQENWAKDRNSNSPGGKRKWLINLRTDVLGGQGKANKNEISILFFLVRLTRITKDIKIRRESWEDIHAFLCL